MSRVDAGLSEGAIPRWEYKVLRVELPSGHGPWPDLEVELNRFGGDGWEVVAFSPEPLGRFAALFASVILKRPSPPARS